MGNSFDILMSAFSSTPCIVFLEWAGSEMLKGFCGVKSPRKTLVCGCEKFLPGSVWLGGNSIGFFDRLKLGDPAQS